VASIFEIGSFQLDPAGGVLTINGRPAALGGRAVAVLTELFGHTSEYLSKARLLEVAWPDAMVEEGNLPVQIAAIREAPCGQRA